MYRKVFLLISAALLLTAQKPLRFEARVDMVSVPVAVTDKDGNLVHDLDPSLFTVYEDGVEQEVTLFAAGLEGSWVGMSPEMKEAMSGKQVIALIMDTSGSMDDEMSLVQSAALKFLDNIPATEHLLFLDFDENIRLSEFSSDDQRQIAERVYDMEAEGWTALYDAVGTVLDRIYHYDGKKTVVVFSDGVDSRSTLGIGDCLEMVKDSSVTIHTIHFGGQRRSPSRLFTQGRFLRQISKMTGGTYAVATSLEQIDELYDRILEELFSQYVLGYISTNTNRDGSYRKIKVEVAQKGIKVRAREGYTGPFDEPDRPDGPDGQDKR